MMRAMAEIRLLRLAWMLLFCPACALAAVANAAWSVRVWNSDDGLPNNIVTSLAQTPDGYLWVANPTRFARFDGVQFEGFQTKTVTGGYNHKITTLVPGQDGSLWVATDRGVVAGLKSGGLRVFTNNLPSSLVELLVEDDEHTLWIKHRGGSSICRIVGGEVVELPMQGSYRSVATDHRGRLWFVSNGEAGLFRNGRFETLAQLGSVRAARLTGAKEGGVWICLGSELFKLVEGKPPVSCGAFTAQSAATEPLVMLEDRAGAVWIGTSDSGLIRYDGTTFESVPVSHAQILCLLEDRESNLWVGTGGGGLGRVRPRAVELQGPESGLPFPTVQSLGQESNGVIWATTQNGLLICRTNGAWQTVSTNTSWPGGRASCVTVDQAGAVWIGTRSQRLNCLRNGQFTALRGVDGMVLRSVHALLATSAGDLWMAGTGPDVLQRLRDGQLETISLPASRLSIHGMVEDAAGDIWIGTAQGRLLRVRNDEITDETANTGGSSISIRTLHATPEGSLWIGYAGGGLGWINQHGRYLRISTEQGLFDDHVSQIVDDDRGWLWLGSDHGVFKVRLQELEALARHEINRVIFVRYGPGEGLAGLQANFGESPRVLRSRDGHLWMPMRTGLVVINPDALREDLVPSVGLLEQMVVDDQVKAAYGGIIPVEAGMDLGGPMKALRLPPNHRHLEFIFTAFSFKAPERIRFQYQLQGFDDDWVDAGTQRRVSYSRLAAGSYQFRVRTGSSEGGWGGGDAGLAFVVTPFFWQTWWFWSLALALFTSSVVAIVRFVSHRQLRLRVRTLERQAALDQERTRIARDIHDDVGNLLTQVTLLSSLTLRDREKPESTREHARQISATVEQMTSSLDEIVWAVNPRNDTLPHLIDYIGQFAVEFLSAAGIACRVDLPDHPPHRAVPADVRHNLFLVVKEALTNVVRHSGADDVSLRVAATEQMLEVMIQDNGRGLDPGKISESGNGLRNMRQRVAELGGRFDMDNTPDGGARLRLSVPWSQRN